MRIDIPSLVLGCLAGVTSTTLAIQLPLDRVDLVLPAAILAAAGLAIHLGVPRPNVTVTSAVPVHPLPLPTLSPRKWMEECGALDRNLDEATATGIVRRKLERTFRDQPDDDASHVVLLRHLLDLACKRRDRAAHDALVDRVNAATFDKSVPEIKIAVAAIAAALQPDQRFPWRQHGTTTTRLMAALDHARKTTGILPTSSFAWLKSLDRPLWYALNNLGRASFHVEGAAAISHYRSELALDGPLHDPYVEGAVIGIMKTWWQIADAAGDGPVRDPAPEPMPA